MRGRDEEPYFFFWLHLDFWVLLGMKK